MQISEAGLNLTKRFEGCKLEAYQDVKGVWTIGWGHTDNVQPGDTITQDQADQWLALDMQWAADVVTKQVVFPIGQSQFAALADLVYNIGSGNFASSTLLTLLNQGDLEGASLEFPKWDKSGGQHILGLHRRRMAEQALFLQT